MQVHAGECVGVQHLVRLPPSAPQVQPGLSARVSTPRTCAADASVVHLYARAGGVEGNHTKKPEGSTELTAARQGGQTHQAVHTWQHAAHTQCRLSAMEPQFHLTQSPCPAPRRSPRWTAPPGRRPRPPALIRKWRCLVGGRGAHRLTGAAARMSYIGCRSLHPRLLHPPLQTRSRSRRCACHAAP